METLRSLEIKKVALLRALQLGDMLCIIPAVRAFKKVFPDVEITLIGLPWAKGFTERFSNYFSDFLEFPGYPGIPEKPFDINNFTNFLHKVRLQNFDLVLQMQGNGSVINPFAELLGAKNIAGYYRQEDYKPNSNFFMEYPEGQEIERHIKLMEFMGIPSGSTELEFPVSEEERKEFKRLSATDGLMPNEYVCIHTGARDKHRWWGAKKFAYIADAIAEQGYSIVLTGTEIEKRAAEEVMGFMQYPAINFVGKTSLGVLAELIKNAQMIFSNDTGVSHIAAATETPSVVVFLTSDPKRWAPLNKKLHRVVLPEYTDDLDYILKQVNKIITIRKEDYRNCA